MRGELSHGLPALAATGNRIVRRDTGDSVILRGVNRSGMEYSEPVNGDFLQSARISFQEIWTIANDWRANLIRLPFNQDWVLNGRKGRSGEEYMAAFDQVIDWAARNGVYTLLDLQWLSMEGDYGRLSDGSVNRIAPLPDEASIYMWRILAERYQEEPAVLFDIYNEPHDVRAEQWQDWAQRLIEAVRAGHEAALIFVSGIDWGYDLRGVPLAHEVNLVYSTHSYPWKEYLSKDRAFGWLTEDRPVFVGEWGGTDDQLGWGKDAVAYFRERGLGHAAWSWADWPHLVRRTGENEWTPTPFGELVKAELAAGA